MPDEARENDTPFGELSGDEQFAVLVSTGTPTADLARIFNISTGQARRRRGSENVKRLVSFLRNAMMDEAYGKLMSLYTRHIDNLDRLSLDENTPAAARIGGSKAVLEIGGKYRKDIEVEARLAAIEARLAQEGQQGGTQ